MDLLSTQLEAMQCLVVGKSKTGMRKPDFEAACLDFAHGLRLIEQVALCPLSLFPVSVSVSVSVSESICACACVCFFLTLSLASSSRWPKAPRSNLRILRAWKF